jgi:hypothetical protein
VLHRVDPPWAWTGVGAAGAAAAGIEALIGSENAGETTHPAALKVLGETLRRDLAGIEALFAGRA